MGLSEGFWSEKKSPMVGRMGTGVPDGRMWMLSTRSVPGESRQVIFSGSAQMGMPGFQ